MGEWGPVSPNFQHRLDTVNMVPFSVWGVSSLSSVQSVISTLILSLQFQNCKQIAEYVTVTYISGRIVNFN